MGRFPADFSLSKSLPENEIVGLYNYLLFWAKASFMLDAAARGEDF